MSLTENQKHELIRHRLARADEAINDAHLLIENKSYRAAINRIYYGMFYSLLALSIEYEYKSSKHSQIIGWFNKTFIHTKLLPANYFQMVYNAFNARTKGDYDIEKDFSLQEVQSMFEEMKLFCAGIKQFVEKKW
jgi:uncharacterized protein (UPF0332 family)